MATISKMIKTIATPVLRMKSNNFCINGKRRTFISLYSLNSLNSLKSLKSLKLLMVEEILCDVRRQIRSIVNLCEEFGVRHTRAKFTHQNNFYLMRKEKRLIFLSAIFVPRTIARSGSSAIWNGIPVFFERRRSKPLIKAPPPAR